MLEHLNLSGEEMLTGWRSYELYTWFIWIGIFTELLNWAIWEFSFLKKFFSAANLFVIYTLFSSKTRYFKTELNLKHCGQSTDLITNLMAW